MAAEEGRQRSIALLSQGIVERSAVEEVTNYREYKQKLRYDFFWSCCYCTITEVEAQGIKFHIDHYVPKSVNAQLVNIYSNLYWSCEICNEEKGDIYPPEEAQRDGLRFLKADEDVYTQHLTCKEYELESLTPTGEFNIDYLSLNRQNLKNLRQYRKLAYECDTYVSKGVKGLYGFSIDQLPANLRARALLSIRALDEAATEIGNSVDELLMFASRSSILDLDSDQLQRSANRAREFKQLRGLYPGDWRGREIKRREREEEEAEDGTEDDQS